MCVRKFLCVLCVCMQCNSIISIVFVSVNVSAYCVLTCVNVCESVLAWCVCFCMLVK